MSVRDFSGLELEVNPGCFMCGGTGRVPESEPIYAGWRYCDCVIDRRKQIPIEIEAVAHAAKGRQ